MKHTGFLHCRSEQLKKELATLKNKNHSLDDMLKSQQRKIRNMIEQVIIPVRRIFGETPNHRHRQIIKWHLQTILFM